MERNTIQFHLRQAITELSQRGLSLSSKWASEQLFGMHEMDDDGIDDDTEHPPRHNGHQDSTESAMSTIEVDALLLAQNLISSGEYHRCAHFLRRHKGGRGIISSRRGLFLKFYALYMAGEKVKDQQSVENSASKNSNGSKSSAAAKSLDPATSKSPSGTGTAKNPYLADTFRELLPLFTAYCSYNDHDNEDVDQPLNKPMDGFLLFIFAVVVRDMRLQGVTSLDLSRHTHSNICGGSSSFEDLISESIEDREFDSFAAIPDTFSLFVEAVREYPWNW